MSYGYYTDKKGGINMSRNKLQGTLAAICAVFVFFNTGHTELSNTYLNLNEDSRLTRQEAADRISGIGGQLRHSFGSGEYIAWLPAMADSVLGKRLTNVYVEDAAGGSL